MAYQNRVPLNVRGARSPQSTPASPEVARSGLTEAEAARAGFEFLTVTIESTTRAGYYPGAAPITVSHKIMFDENQSSC